MTRHKYFVEYRIKTKKGTLSEGVTEKDTKTRFRIEFVGSIWNNQGKHKQSKIWSLDGSESLWNNFSKEEPRERPTLGILLIK